MTLFSIEGLIADSKPRNTGLVSRFKACGMQFLQEADGRNLSAEDILDEHLQQRSAALHGKSTAQVSNVATIGTVSKRRDVESPEENSEEVETRVTTREGISKPTHSYIALISKAILSSPNKKMLLGEIYQYIMNTHPYYRSEDKYWRNSIRHNLSLNECFIKVGRSDNGKGNYWAIHPANVDDFAKGDFRRRRARRRARKSQLLGELTQSYRGAEAAHYPMQYASIASQLPFPSHVAVSPLSTSQSFFPSPSLPVHSAFSSVPASHHSFPSPMLYNTSVPGIMQTHTPSSPLSTPALATSSFLASPTFTPPSALSAPPSFSHRAAYPQWCDRSYGGFRSLFSRFPSIHKFPM